MDLTAGGIWHFYDGRVAMEPRICELREDYALRKIPTSSFAANALYMEIIRLAYNLVTAFQAELPGGILAELDSSKLRHKLLAAGELTRPQNPRFFASNEETVGTSCPKRVAPCSTSSSSRITNRFRALSKTGRHLSPDGKVDVAPCYDPFSSRAAAGPPMRQIRLLLERFVILLDELVEQGATLFGQLVPTVSSLEAKNRGFCGRVSSPGSKNSLWRQLFEESSSARIPPGNSAETQ